MNDNKRIIKNEKRLDDTLQSIKLMQEALYIFKSNKKNIDLLNKYYGSKEWFKDKEDLEQKRITGIKAGVLSEDAVWNMNEDIKELLIEMNDIINLYSK